MGLWGIIKDIEKKHEEVNKSMYTASEVNMRMEEAKLRMMKAEAKMYEHMTSPPMLTTSGSTYDPFGPASMHTTPGTGGLPWPAPTGVPSRTAFLGFDKEMLVQINHLLHNSRLEKHELLDIVKTYCKVKEKVER